MPSGVGFPEGNPLLERPRRKFRRSAKEMDVIRHEDISANRPRCRQGLGLAKHGLHGTLSKGRFATCRADRQKNNRWHVESLMQTRMCGMLATGFVHAGTLSMIMLRQRKIRAWDGRCAVPYSICWRNTWALTAQPPSNGNAAMSAGGMAAVPSHTRFAGEISGR